jgi:hypothetical protein
MESFWVRKVMNSKKNYATLSGIVKVVRLSMPSRVDFINFIRFKAKRKDTRTGFPWVFCLSHKHAYGRSFFA